MREVNLAGQVVIVTGAGRGLGRQYALDLAKRGARVVINDLAGDVKFSGATSAAEEVVELIRSNGGEAIADFSDVCDPAGGRRMVDAAMKRWHRLDAIITNAGIPGADDGLLVDTPGDAVRRVLDVNVIGAVNLIQAAWPTMASRGYGRIVNVTSHACFGAPGAVSKAISRAGILGLTSALALEGVASGIKVNAVLPTAVTRMSERISDPDVRALLDPDVRALLREQFEPSTVSPIVVLLASEHAPTTGETFHAGGGLVARVSIGIGQGVTGIRAPEDLLVRAAAARNMTDATFAQSADAAMEHVIDRVLPKTESSISVRTRKFSIESGIG